jgi:hypothetical protein
MNIAATANPSTSLANCSYEHIHGRAAAVELVLDKSGSMGAGGKLQAARTAASAFIDTIFPMTQIRPGTYATQHYGVVLYNQAASFLDTEPLLPIGNVEYVVPSATQNTQVVTALDRIAAGGSTSIGAGLALARGALQANIPLSPANASDTVRPAILVLSDGMENTAPFIAGEIPALVAEGIPVYAIGFGESYQLDEARLQELSATTGGRYRHTNDPDDLSKFFLEVLVDSFVDTQMILDPKGTVAGGQSQTIPFPVSTLDKMVTVVLTWRDPAKSLDFEIQAPNRTVPTRIPPSWARAVDRGRAYKVLSVPVCESTNTRGCVVPGEWRAQVSVPSGSAENYSLTVLSHSTAQLLVSTPVIGLATGSRIAVEARARVGDRVVPSVQLEAVLSAPTENANHRIAAYALDISKLLAPGPRDGLPMLGQVKGQQVYGKHPVPRKVHPLPFQAVSAPGGVPQTYRGVFDATRFPGSYNMTVRATWKDDRGFTVRRETTRSLYLPALPAAKSDIRVKVLAQDKAAGTRMLRIDFTPRDRFGDLVGVGRKNDIALGAPEQKLGAFEDLGNGGYRIETAVPRDWQSLRLSMGGQVWRVGVGDSR